MSSDIPGIPPAPPTPPLPPPPPAGGGWVPPPPPGGPAPGGLPWERRSELGFVNAFLETIKLFVTNPAAAWQQTKEKGDYAEPLIFAILVSWIGIAVSSVWSGLFGQAWTAFLPPEMKEKLGGAMATNAGALLIQVGTRYGSHEELTRTLPGEMSQTSPKRTMVPSAVRTSFSQNTDRPRRSSKVALEYSRTVGSLQARPPSTERLYSIHPIAEWPS